MLYMRISPVAAARRFVRPCDHHPRIAGIRRCAPSIEVAPLRASKRRARRARTRRPARPRAAARASKTLSST
ncbi:hypothetical protein BURMUCF2_B0046 [Burkholderia multivorans CF2]|nr:hypothetical protein BURMUCF2_B0046 [Burkholderia multivorans CF2]